MGLACDHLCSIRSEGEALPTHAVVQCQDGWRRRGRMQINSTEAINVCTARHRVEALPVGVHHKFHQMIVVQACVEGLLYHALQIHLQDVAPARCCQDVFSVEGKSAVSRKASVSDAGYSGLCWPAALEG